MSNRLNVATFILFLLSSCGKDLPSLQGIDTEKWKEDKNACAGLRSAMQESLKSELPKLKGLSEANIITLLGKPDHNELYKRNQKFFHYFLTPGPGCNSPDSVSHTLVVRFNAMGYAQLVFIE
jgi:hypothetical protein